MRKRPVLVFTILNLTGLYMLIVILRLPGIPIEIAVTIVVIALLLGNAAAWLGLRGSNAWRSRRSRALFCFGIAAIAAVGAVLNAAMGNYAMMRSTISSAVFLALLGVLNWRREAQKSSQNPDLDKN